ncbi:unnamed protein product [Polarella glacialis]|uniref:Uncharacterized protein n=1 Tax=Polarella glacialis TaxID=89957 RepID=A0A813GWV6_POLGL|nr:unnamed protein product [Polarella glacialis]CAE8711961.1 unnamed protein product [Polarella glacialis]
MLRALRMEKARRAAGRGTLAENDPRFHTEKVTRISSCTGDEEQRKNYPILTMNHLMLETFPKMSTLEGARMHSIDVGGFLQKDGLRNAKPFRLDDDPEHAWLTDTGTWHEDHSSLYDTALYLQISDGLARTGDSVPALSEFLCELSCRFGWAMLRHNDIIGFYDLAKADTEHVSGDGRSMRPLFDPSHYSGINLDAMKLYNLEVLALKRSPEATLRQFMSAQRHIGPAYEYNFGNKYLAKHWATSFLPSRLNDVPRKQHSDDMTTLGEELQWIAPLFQVAGFQPMAATFGTLRLLRVEVPTAMFYLIASQDGFLDEQQAISAHTPQHSSCVQPRWCDLFLDMWYPTQKRRMAVWVMSPDSGKGLATIVEDTTLELPLGAILLSVQRPLPQMKFQPHETTKAEMELAAIRVCRNMGVLGEPWPSELVAAVPLKPRYYDGSPKNICGSFAPSS